MPENEKTRANLLLLGRSGTGKSEFINYILGNHIAQTGCGEPVTQGFRRYSHILTNGLPITIYDSKGLEVDNLEKIAEKIYTIVKVKTQANILNDWFHAVFYFINLKRSRLEDTEKDLINKIHEITKQPVYIIITHCEAEGTKKEELMKREVESIPGVATIFRINSVDYCSKKGERIPAFGKKEIEDALPAIIWENTSNKLSDYAANRLCQELKAKLILQREKELANIEKMKIDKIKNMPEDQYIKHLFKNIGLILHEVAEKDHPMLELNIKHFKRLNESVSAVFYNISVNVMLNILFFVDLPWAELGEKIENDVNSNIQEIIKNRDFFQTIINQIKQTIVPDICLREKRKLIAEVFYKELNKAFVCHDLIARYVYERLQSVKPEYIKRLE